MSDSSPNNNEKQKSRKCLIWGSLAFIMASSTIGGAYYLSSIANATTEVARLLAEEKANVNTEDSVSPPSLSVAANDSQTEAEEIPAETVETPIEAVVDINQKAKEGLKERGIDVDWVRREDWDRLYYADDVEGLRYLITVETQKKLEWNTLRIMNFYIRKACARNAIEIVKLLLEKGADVNNANDEGWTLLHIAAQNGYTEIAKLLIKEGAIVNKSDKDKWTPLYAAASKGHTETVKLLLEAWANPDMKTDYDRTPLYIAAEEGHTEIVKLLIKGGADVNLKRYGSTPAKVAQENGHTEIYELLKAAGGKD